MDDAVPSEESNAKISWQLTLAQSDWVRQSRSAASKRMLIRTLRWPIGGGALGATVYFLVNWQQGVEAEFLMAPTLAIIAIGLGLAVILLLFWWTGTFFARRADREPCLTATFTNERIRCGGTEHYLPLWKRQFELTDESIGQVLNINLKRTTRHRGHVHVFFESSHFPVPAGCESDVEKITRLCKLSSQRNA